MWRGGSGGSADGPTTNQSAISISYSALPSSIYSYQRLSIDVNSNYSDCKYVLSGDDIHWIQSSGNTFNFNAPITVLEDCLLYTSPSPRDKRQSRMPSSA